jgi:hypothetical protein
MYAASTQSFGRSNQRELPELAQYALLSAVVISSGNPIATVWGAQLPWLVLGAVAIVVAFYLKIKLLPSVYLVIGSLSIISVLHVGFFGTAVAAASAGFVLKLIIAAVCAATVQKLAIKLIWIMTALAGMSLVFYLPLLFGVDLVGLLAPFSVSSGDLNLVTVGLHTYNFTEGATRNSGMFWEPGAFAGYLTLALLFFTISKDRTQVSVVGILIIVAALLTTRSTIGYAALAMIALLMAANPISKRRSPLGLAAAAVGTCALLFLFVALSTNLEFLAAKTIYQWESALSGKVGNETTRFGQIIFDMRDILQRPVTGWSASPQPRFGGSAAIEAIIQGQGNGLSGFVVRYGFLGGLIAMLGTFFGMLRWSSSIVATVVSVAIIGLLLFGQQFLNYPTFLMLFFLRPPRIQLARLPVVGQRVRGASTPAHVVPSWARRP